MDSFSRPVMPDTPQFAVTSVALDPAPVVAVAECAMAARGAGAGAAGAVTTFLGIVRAHNAGRTVLRLEYEAFAPLAVKTFARIDEEARASWPGACLAIHHRVGTLTPGQASVIIAAASAHRGDAFAACRFAIERIKQIAPIWKHEYFEGGDVWIEGATADPDDDRAREEARRLACA
jgi:molybdopterin synthase catalytic subunit